MNINIITKKKKKKKNNEATSIIPMDGDIVLDMVNHFNHEPVTFPCDDPRSGDLPVNCHNALCLA